MFVLLFCDNSSTLSVAHFASDNIREKTLAQVLRSEFLTQIRASDAAVRCGRLGCALFENREMVEDIAANTGARRTDGAGVESGPGI